MFKPVTRNFRNLIEPSVTFKMGQRRRAYNHWTEEAQVPPGLMPCSYYMNISWPVVNRF